MQSQAIPYQRINAPLAAIPGKLAEMGVDPDSVFAGFSMQSSDLVQGNLVPFPDAVSLLARCAEATKCPHFGLLLGEGHDHRSMGLLGEVMANAETVGEALLDMVQWQLGNSRAAASYFYHSGGPFILGYGIYESSAPGIWQAYDLAMTMGRNIISGLSAGAKKPDDILISHRPPANRQPYERILQCIPQFDQSQSCLVLPDDVIHHPIAGADPVKRAAGLEKLRKMSHPAGSSISARARHWLRGAICIGDVSKTSLARKLDLHPKTLERRLAAEGSSFEQLRDEVRYAVARDLLQLTELPVGEIAFALSFASHSTFDHAFRRWSGKAPSEWRVTSSESYRISGA